MPKFFSPKIIISLKKFSVTTHELKFLVSQHYAHNPFFWAGAFFLKSGKVSGKSKLDKNKCPKSKIPKYFWKSRFFL